MSYTKVLWERLTKAYPGLEVPDISYYDYGEAELTWGEYNLSGGYVRIDIYPSGELDCYCRESENQPMKLYESTADSLELPKALSQFVSVTDGVKVAKFYETLDRIKSKWQNQ